MSAAASAARLGLRRFRRTFRAWAKRYTFEGSTLKKLRLVYQTFFLTLFFLLLGATTQSLLGGYPVSIFLEADPLVALTTMLASGTLYMGLAWAAVISGITLIFGRIFCSWMCPLGILNQISGILFPAKRTDEQKMAVNRPRALYNVKYYLLTFFIVSAAFGSLQVGLMDPICLVVRSFSVSILPATHELNSALYPQLNFNWGWVVGGIFIAILVANRFIPRFWCRALCPLGALLGVLS
ncbi:MAG: polyferredoxin, partial [Myxococcota bacterium]